MVAVSHTADRLPIAIAVEALRLARLAAATASAGNACVIEHLGNDQRQHVGHPARVVKLDAAPRQWHLKGKGDVPEKNKKNILNKF